MRARDLGVSPVIANRRASIARIAACAACLIGACTDAPADPAAASKTATTSAATPIRARGLGPWPGDELALRPAAGLAGPPAVNHIPAFDRAHIGDLDGPTPDAPGIATGIAIGTPQRGYLVRGVPLPDREPALAARPVSLERHAIYGTRAFVGALTAAARHVAELAPGSVLYAGDLATAEGGPLPPHKSHANGRDADLSFYVATRDGALADNPGMRPVAADGAVAGSALVFDAARNWALVEALLRDPSIQVQWIFCATRVRALLLGHAARAHADPTIIARAERVLAQPGDSSPHDDHFHVRVFCAEDERLEGCLDAPPFYPWIDDHADAVARWYQGVAGFLDLAPRAEFRWAVERIVRMHAVQAIPRLTTLASHPDASVRNLVADALGVLERRSAPAAWKRWAIEDDVSD